MGIIKAKRSFEQALQVAEASNDSYREFVAAGLLELAKAVQELRTVIDDVRRRQK